jgi:hypothetical protein
MVVMLALASTRSIVPTGKRVCCGWFVAALINLWMVHCTSTVITVEVLHATYSSRVPHLVHGTYVQGTKITATVHCTVVYNSVHVINKPTTRTMY